MESAMTLAAVIGPVYLVLGLSLLFYSKQWQKVAGKWADNHLSMLTLMLMYLILGVVIVNVYNVWEWNVWLLVTLTGWGMLIKGALYFLAPESVTTSLLEMRGKQPMLYLGGIVITAMGAALTYSVYWA